MTNKIASLKNEIIEIFQNGGEKADAVNYINEKTGLGRTQCYYWAKRIYDEYSLFEDKGETYSEDKVESDQSEFPNDRGLINDLEYADQYVFNRDDDKYVFLLHKALGKNIVVDGAVVRALVKTYTNYDGDPATINETCIKYKIPRNALIHILRILGVTHDALPFTPEEILDREEDELVEEVINDKRFVIAQKIQKRDWQETVAAARNWNTFMSGTVDPLQTYLENWTPPTAKYATISRTLDSNEKWPTKTFLTVLTDNHIGELTQNAFVGGEYNSDIAVKNIFSYLNQIETKVNERRVNFDKVVLVCLGDILNSCLDGKTRKGTQLTNDIINEELFDLGVNVIVSFVEGLRSIFGTVEVKCTKGNHDSILSYAMYLAASKYFREDKHISFEITKKYIDGFKIGNNFFLYSHGGADVIKSSLPRNKAKLENLVQSLFLNRAKELVGVKGKYFLTGHTHSFEHTEFNEFEFIVCSASVNSDEFAETLGYWSKPRQQSFVIGEDYLEETIHFNL